VETFSKPSRRESKERDMWPSCEVGSRFREMARWRSRRESLMWSARRKYWFGLAMLLLGLGMELCARD